VTGFVNEWLSIRVMTCDNVSGSLEGPAHISSTRPIRQNAGEQPG
jgi:hypothetical protein